MQFGQVETQGILNTIKVGLRNSCGGETAPYCVVLYTPSLFLNCIELSTHIKSASKFE